MFDRVVSDVDALRGKSRIRGTRLSVEFILELVASDATRQDILTAYPYLAAEDVEEAHRYAAGQTLSLLQQAFCTE